VNVEIESSAKDFALSSKKIKPCRETKAANARTFRNVVPVSKTGKCCWKNHATGAMREVIGYLDAVAAQSPARFVWSSVKTIIYGSSKWDRDKKYSRSSVFAALAKLKQLGIVRKEFLSAGDRPVEGLIVRTHDSMCRHDQRFCVFDPQSEMVVAVHRDPKLDSCDHESDCDCTLIGLS
jgi:hypothetical protein